MDKITIINDYVTANQAYLKGLCRKFYRGNYLYEDLFQEFYIRMTELPEQTIFKYQNFMRYLCYGVVRETYSRRHRSKSKLNGPIPLTDLDITHREYGDRQYYTNPTESKIAESPPEYLNDLHEFIEAELNKPHGFAPIMVFIQGQDESLRSLERKTKVNINALSNYYKDGQRKLQRLLA